MVEFLDAYDIQTVNQNEVKNINILITTNEIEAIILTPTREKKLGEFYHIFKELISIPL